MAEIERLKKNVEFKNVYKKGKSIPDKFVVIYLCKNTSNVTRVGFTASKKVGNSVKRNKARRLMKETFRKNSDNIKTGYDIVFIARVAIINANYFDVEKSISRVMKKAKIYKK